MGLLTIVYSFSKLYKTCSFIKEPTEVFSLNNQDLIFETDRLLIRPFKQGDYLNWHTQHENRLPSQYKYDNGKGDMSKCTQDWFNKMVEEQQHLISQDKDYIFGVFLKQNGDNIGTLDISTLMRYDFQWARIGYTFYNQFWNKGYGREAVKGLIEMAFVMLGYHRIEAHINVDNTPSIKLAENVGLEFECIRKGFVFEFGEWTDNLIYYINSNE
jgi:[ribosomal protein S5]-alanine N-acetyltransferase